MILETISLENFRNYETADLTFDPGINVIWGNNGQGKTNLLEAVHILSFTKSMRAGREADCILFGREYARIAASIQYEGETHTLEIAWAHTKKRQLKQDGVKCVGARDWMGCLPVVFFGPQELNLIQEGPSFRRRFLDMALCQLKPRYTHALSVYKRVHEHKCKILRNYLNKPDLLNTLPDFNMKLAQSGAIVLRERAEYITRLREKAAFHHKNISRGVEFLTLRYQTNIPVEDKSEEQLEALLLEAFERKREKELHSGMALVGPHRDDIIAILNDHEARMFASQGQAKTAALALKMAERDLLEEGMETTPVLLLDDVLSELDVTRREYILRYQTKGQCLMTDCEPSRLKGLQTGKTIQIEAGKIKE